MRQAGEVTYAGMCQSIYQQFEFMSELVLSMLNFALLLQMRISRIATKGEYLKYITFRVRELPRWCSEHAIRSEVLEANVA